VETLALIPKTALIIGIGDNIAGKLLTAKGVQVYIINTIKQTCLILALICLLQNWSNNPFIDIAYRSIIIGILTLVFLYKFKISLPINNIIDKSWEKIKYVLTKNIGDKN
jgi:Na+-transporting NADH:ubiquinone oxidoreductase subunit NqrB